MKDLLTAFFQEKRKFRAMFSAQDPEKVDKEYYDRFVQFMERQYNYEANRRERGKTLAEVYEFLYYFEKIPKLGENVVWNDSKLDPSEALEIQRLFDEKMGRLSQTLDRDPIIEGDDIMSQIDSHFKAKYKDLDEFDKKEQLKQPEEEAEKQPEPVPNPSNEDPPDDPSKKNSQAPPLQVNE
eukprot:TRINITY_DN920_c0_g2_i4.p1 TRINITY_DN920_c0_g2~~TRINITY_DN920_c0_g2_i4.p1  ORF type:complete len:182 (+),score=46.75 TRINITY_DN920_c0_g2_i4:156-701(+)